MNRSSFLLSIALPWLASAMFAQNAAEPEIVAEVDGQRILLQDLRQVSGERLAKLEEQAYQLKRQELEEMITARLLAGEARRRNISVASLIDAEITSKAAAVTPEEIHRVYELNKNQLQKPEAEVQEQIRTLLRDQKIAQRRQEYARSLQANAKVSIHLDPPPPFRTEVGTQGPSRGAADAPVTIVEFEDFQCPFCKKAQSTVEQILSRYQGKVRVVHRDFPLQPLHPASLKAHEAARCAEEQGKFWEYRDLLYKNTPAASPDQLKDYASLIGLNLPSFNQCLDSGKFQMVVEKDETEGGRLGVQGTPAFFINGRPLPGAQPESEFARVVDEELNKRERR